MLGYILPVLCYFRIVSLATAWARVRGAWSSSSPYFKQSVCARVGVAAHFAGLWAILLFGCVSMVAGVLGVFV